MTRINAKVKLHCVDKLFVGPQFQTPVWISGKALKALTELDKRERERFGLKLQSYAASGFNSFVGGPIRREWDGVFRIGQTSSLFRLIGFFDGSAFIVIDGFTKRGTKLSAAERRRIDEVARVKSEVDWRKNQ